MFNRSPRSVPYRMPSRRAILYALLCPLLLSAGCSGDVRENPAPVDTPDASGPTDTDGTDPTPPTDAEDTDPTPPTDTETPVVIPPTSDNDSDTDTPPDNTDTQDFTLNIGNLPNETGTQPLQLIEGGETVIIAVKIGRSDTFSGDITLAVEGQTETDERQLNVTLNKSLLSADEEFAQLSLQLAIDRQPIQSHQRTLNIVATSENGTVFTRPLTIDVTPTDAPDIYLLIGQSNMVGSTKDGVKRAEPGEADAPVERIRQLNVTFNDTTNFASADDFTNPEKLYNTGNPLVMALDPLHSGLEADGRKSGTRIGLGLSFAKQALVNTRADIFLVPAAWSDTGFCPREQETVTGLSWNPPGHSNPLFSGTLLYDRAIERTSIALELTGGVLRGILWHQGEADTEPAECAESYAANLDRLIRSLRTDIPTDTRGPSARGPDADIPFIAGTMSASEDQLPFSATKLLVDRAHRALNSETSLPFTGTVDNDELIAPSYPCGDGGCIHFGADALRLMGQRYYEVLLDTIAAP